jgi:hypothetical protein
MRANECDYFFLVVFFAFLAGAFFVAMCRSTFLSREMMSVSCSVGEPSGAAGRGDRQMPPGDGSPGAPHHGATEADYFFFAFFFAFFLAAFFFAGIRCPPPFGYRVRCKRSYLDTS